MKIRQVTIHHDHTKRWIHDVLILQSNLWMHGSEHKRGFVYDENILEYSGNFYLELE